MSAERAAPAPGTTGSCAARENTDERDIPLEVIFGAEPALAWAAMLERAAAAARAARFVVLLTAVIALARAGTVDACKLRVTAAMAERASARIKGSCAAALLMPMELLALAGTTGTVAPLVVTAARVRAAAGTTGSAALFTEAPVRPPAAAGAVGRLPGRAVMEAREMAWLETGAAPVALAVALVLARAATVSVLSTSDIAAPLMVDIPSIGHPKDVRPPDWRPMTP